MDWYWPDLLLLLGVPPLALAIYIWVLQWQRRFASRYSSLSLVEAALPAASWRRRHFAFSLFVGALACLAIAAARPVIPVNAFSGRTTIILTLDISRSMCMRDIQPTRLEVAKEAARSFVEHPVPGTQIGVVAFAGFAELAQAPTTDIDGLEFTISSLTTATNTAIGSGILRSLDAIAEVDKSIPKSEAIDESAAHRPEQIFGPTSPRGSPVPHIIVLLTDGASNSGPDPLLAAGQAAERGVRIYTIGFGTTRSAVMECRNELAGNPRPDGFDPPPGSGSFGAGPDAATLKEIANMTGGKFYAAASAGELQAVFQELQKNIALTNRTAEISVYFVGLATLLAAAAFLLSLIWHPFL